MRCKNYDEAVKQAQANADRSGIAWVVLSDTSGNWHAESTRSTSPDAECVAEVRQPTRPLQCVICRGTIETEAVTGWSGGHNAEPVMDGRCCSDCNALIVVPTRIRRVYRGT